MLAILACAIALPTPPPAAIAQAGPEAPRGTQTNVRQFGAVGDGQADDTLAIQRAIESGVAYLPTGTFRITRTLEIDLSRIGFSAVVGDGTARLLMDGSGPAIRFRGSHAGTADPSSVQEVVWARERTPFVDGIEIVGGHAEADGIEAIGTMQLTVTRVAVRRARHAIRLVQRNRNVLIANCHLYDNRGCGVFYDQVNLHQSNITASHISYNRGGGVVVRGGDVRNIQISGCDIEGNMGADQPPTANVLLDCADGTVAEVAITGCTIQHEAKSPDSANIRILGAGTVVRRGEPQKFNCGHVTIADNVLSDVQFNIDLEGVRGATVVGNTLWQGYAANIRLNDCQQVVVGANMLERNPLYGYTAEARNGVIVTNCRDCTLTNLHVHHVQDSEAGVVVRNCRRMHISALTILDCDNGGMLLDNVSSSRIAGCLIRNDRVAQPADQLLKISGGEDNQIGENTLRSRP